MKILAVRGANLASLERRFEVDFAEGPLAEAGVFAITGPTGAGKSTLLDAICLALFGTAPRLGGRVRVGRPNDDDDRITTSDPRSILRKGAGRGFAEVDFRGVDGRAYRARWEARRARDQPDGKLQPATLAIGDLTTGTPLSLGRKTEAKEAIAERLGLTFEQFRRSVLLAQGEFASFLDAEPRDRADLLERVTGTEIYGLISMETHARAGDERRRLESLSAQAARVSVLSPVERAQLEGEVPGLQQRVREDELAVHRAADSLRWHNELGAIRREEEEARLAHQQVETQLSLAETRRAILQEYEGALPLKPFLITADTAEAELSRAEAQHQVAVEQCEAGQTARQTAQATFEIATAQADGIDAAAAWHAAETRRAQTLQAEITKHSRTLDRTRDEHRVLEERRATLTDKLAELNADADAQRASADGDETWLNARPWARPDADQLRLEELLSDWVAVLGGIARADERLSTLTQSESEHSARADETQREAEARDAERKAAAMAATEAIKAADASEPERLARERAQARTRQRALAVMVEVSAQAQDAYEAQVRHREQAEARAQNAGQAERRAKDCDRKRRSLALALREAESTLERLRATADLAEHREDLREGEPCPLCGSHAHPYAGAEEFAESQERLLRSQRERVESLRHEILAIEEARAQARADRRAHADSAQNEQREAERWEAKMAEARERYQVTAAQLDEDNAAWPAELGDGSSAPDPGERPEEAQHEGSYRSGPPTRDSGPPTRDWGPLFAAIRVQAPDPKSALLSETARAALVAAAAEAQREADEAETREVGARELLAEVRRCQDAHEVARNVAEHANSLAQTTRDELRAVQQERQAWTREKQRLKEVEAELDRRLGLSLGEHPDFGRRRTDPANFGVQLSDELERARKVRARLETARKDIALLAPQIERTRMDLQDAESHCVRAERGVKEQLRRVEALRRECPAPLGRERVHELRARASDLRRDAFERQRGAERDLAAAKAGEQAARSRVEEASGVHGQARAELGTQLERFEIEEEEARHRLSENHGSMEGLRSLLRELDRARAESLAVYEERTRRRAQHEEEQPPSFSSSSKPQDSKTAEATLSFAQRRLADTRDLLMMAQSRLRQDNERRSEVDKVQAAIEGQRERLSVWESLSDLIGSATGNKFRVFAQSLTLELLVDHSNVHLAQLAPRYSLERVPGYDVALQVVDHEMGDEIRSTSSLSGGESFLVSLGLALGLGSLSGQDTRVESLFIDEGFGTLDAESLDAVLAALDVLRATGRQVGLISHVPSVSERFETRVEVFGAGPARSGVRIVSPGQESGRAA